MADAKSVYLLPSKWRHLSYRSMRRRSRGCIRREDTMNVGMILPFSRNAYVGNFRHAPLVPGTQNLSAVQPATQAARSMLPSALRNNPLVGALAHAPHSQGLKTLLAESSAAGAGYGSSARAARPQQLVTRVGITRVVRPSSPVSACSSDGRASPMSCTSADHEYGGISSWATRMGSVLDSKEDHLETWGAGGPRNVSL